MGLSLEPCLLGGSSQLGYVVSNPGDRFRPQFLGLFHFQMAELHGLHTNWDGPPRPAFEVEGMFDEGLLFLNLFCVVP